LLFFDLLALLPLLPILLLVYYFTIQHINNTIIILAFITVDNIDIIIIMILHIDNHTITNSILTISPIHFIAQLTILLINLQTIFIISDTLLIKSINTPIILNNRTTLLTTTAQM